MARAHVSMRGEVGDRERRAESRAGPVECSGDGIRSLDRCRDGRFHELRLSAVPVRGDDQVPRDSVGDLGAEVAPNEVHREVDGRSRSG